MFCRKVTKLRMLVSWATDIEIQNREYRHEARDSNYHISTLYVTNNGQWWSSRRSKVAIKKSTISKALIMVVSSLPNSFFDDLNTAKTLGKLVQCSNMVKLTMHATMGGENRNCAWKPKLLTLLGVAGAVSSCHSRFKSKMDQKNKVRSLHGGCADCSSRNRKNPRRIKEKGWRK